MNIQTRSLWSDAVPVAVFLSMLVFLAWVAAPSFAVNPNKPLEAFSVLAVPIAWIAIGMGNGLYYRRTREYVEAVDFEGLIFIILAGCGLIGIVLNMRRKDDPPTRPFFRTN